MLSLTREKEALYSKEVASPSQYILADARVVPLGQDFEAA